MIAANRADPRLWDFHVRGIGHEHRADEAAGFTPAEQRAMLFYLLHYQPPPVSEE